MLFGYPEYSTEQSRKIKHLQEKLDSCVDIITRFQQLHEDLFGHCLSNGVFNAWGKRFDCTNLNNIAHDAEKFLKGELYREVNNIKELNHNISMLQATLASKMTLLESCETALAERDVEVMRLARDNAELLQKLAIKQKRSPEKGPSEVKDLVELKPYRQTWLTPEVLHSAPSAQLCYLGFRQYAQLEHPKGGPLTCVENRTGRPAKAVVKHNGRWCWKFDVEEVD